MSDIHLIRASDLPSVGMEDKLRQIVKRVLDMKGRQKAFVVHAIDFLPGDRAAVYAATDASAATVQGWFIAVGATGIRVMTNLASQTAVIEYGVSLHDENEVSS